MAEKTDREQALECALRDAYDEMNGDYVDDVWGRDLSYIRKLIPGLPKRRGLAVDADD